MNAIFKIVLSMPFSGALLILACFWERGFGGVKSASSGSAIYGLLSFYGLFSLLGSQ